MAQRYGYTGYLEPAIARRRGRSLLVALTAASIIIGAGVGGSYLLLGPRPAAPAGPGVGTAVAAPPPNPVEPVGQPAPPPAPPTAHSAPPPAAIPATLRAQAAADRADVDRVVGRWVPQIWAKAPGLVVGGVRYDEARILAEFRELRASYPDAALLRSADYRSFAKPGYWVVVLPRTFGSADAANAWCAKRGFATDDCFAKRLSRTGGPTGNTALRR